MNVTLSLQRSIRCELLWTLSELATRRWGQALRLSFRPPNFNKHSIPSPLVRTLSLPPQVAPCSSSVHICPCLCNARDPTGILETAWNKNRSGTPLATRYSFTVYIDKTTPGRISNAGWLAGDPGALSFATTRQTERSEFAVPGSSRQYSVLSLSIIHASSCVVAAAVCSLAATSSLRGPVTPTRRTRACVERLPPEKLIISEPLPRVHEPLSPNITDSPIIPRHCRPRRLFHSRVGVRSLCCHCVPPACPCFRGFILAGASRVVLLFLPHGITAQARLHTVWDFESGPSAHRIRRAWVVEAIFW
jgi:hypothetical protein